MRRLRNTNGLLPCLLPQGETELKPCSTPGIYEMPFDEYLADPCPEPSFSSDVANAIVNRSPRHAWHRHPKLNPDHTSEANTAMDIGTAAHALFLESDDRRIVVVAAGDYRTKAAQAAREEARKAGLIPLLGKHYDVARAVADASCDAWNACSELDGLFKKRLAERTLLWKEDEAGKLWCRARPDLLSDDHTLEVQYKTTGMSAEPDSFGSGYLIRGGYHLQAYHHCRGVEEIKRYETKRQTRCIWMVQEINPPYGCSFIGMSPSLRALAESQWEHAFGVWRTCLESGDWPAYPDRICWVDAPNWQLKRWTERPDVSNVDGVLDAMEHIGSFVT